MLKELPYSIIKLKEPFTYDAQYCLSKHWLIKSINTFFLKHLLFFPSKKKHFLFLLESFMFSLYHWVMHLVCRSAGHNINRDRNPNVNKYTLKPPRQFTLQIIGFIVLIVKITKEKMNHLTSGWTKANIIKKTKLTKM